MHVGRQSKPEVRKVQLSVTTKNVQVKRIINEGNKKETKCERKRNVKKIFSRGEKDELVNESLGSRKKSLSFEGFVKRRMSNK